MQPLFRAAMLLGLLLASLAVIAQEGDASKENEARIEDEFRKSRERMVERQILRRGIKTEQVLEAMRAVLRHRLTPAEYRAESYSDTPLPIGCGQTISQPYIVALMTDLLQVGKGDRVLEVGTGSGYQAAVLSEIVEQVYSIEIYQELHERARRNLGDLGHDNVTLRHGDGALGWAEHAPFDGIIVTCAASHIPQALIEQLKPGGKMVIPVGPPFGTQRLIVAQKDDQGKMTTRTITSVRFVPLLTPRDVDDAPEADDTESGEGTGPDEKGKMRD